MRLTLRAAALTACVVVSSLSLGPAAHAGFGGDEGCTGPATAAAKASDANTAPSLQPDTATVIVGGYVAVDVLANDTDADGDDLTLVSVSSTRYGYTCIDDNLLVYSGGRGPRSGTDRLTYAVTDGDSYRTSTLTVTYEEVPSAEPRVTRKLKVSNGKVTRKATVEFTNPSATYPVHVRYGDYQRDDWSDEVVLAPGASTSVVTKARYLAFAISVEERDAGAYLTSGVVRTKTGTVESWDDDYYRSSPGRTAPALRDVARAAQR